MKTNKTRFYLNEKQWNLISPMLPPENGRNARPSKSNKLMIEGIIWKLRTGCPWRDLPKDFGPWQSVYTRFSRWSKQGIFQNLFEELKDFLSCEDVALDSTTVRVHQHGHGAAKKKWKTKNW